MRFRHTAFVLLIGVLACSAAWAQLDNASILGTVRDSSGAVIPGATVTIQNLGTSATTKVTTDQSGAFAAPTLPIGLYTLTASAPGFKTFVQEGIRLNVADVIKLPVTLNPGEISEKITVEAEPVAVQTASATLGGVVDSQQVSELPLNGRALTQLLATIPGFSLLGVEANVSGTTTGRLFEAGARFLLDGIDSGQVDSDLADGGYGTAARMTRASVESIAEVRVQENSFSAEYGQSGGGVVNFITKSGTNQFHGSLFEFFRNEKLDARNYFNPAPAAKPEVRLNQFGGSLGGPIIRDRLFFFVNYEGVQQRTGTAFDVFVPTEAFRATVNPAVLPALNMLPLPNGPTSAADPRLGEFRQALSNKLSENTFAIKGDYYITAKDRVSARYNLNPSTTVTENGVAEGQATTIPYRAQLGKITYTRTISPNLLNEAGVGVNRLFTKDISASTDEVRNFPLVFVGSGVPQIGPSVFDLVVGNTSYTYLDTLSWVKGPHQMKFGTQILRAQANKLSNFQTLLFFLGLGNDPLFFGSNVPFAIETIGNPTAGQREWMTNLFAQDDWQVRKNLTFNIGLRYQYETAPSEAHGRNANFNFATGQLEPLGTPIFDASKTNFAPRFGFAWTPFDKKNFVIRGGYGIFYTSINPAVAQFEPTNNGNFSQQRLVTIFDNPLLTAFPATNISSAPVSGLFVPIPKDYKTPYNQDWNLNIQQGIGQSTVLQVAYIGNKGTHYSVFTDPNRIDPVTHTRPYPNFASMLEYWGCCNTSYEALQVSLKRRFSHRLAFNVNYTYGHSLDQGEFGFGSRPNDDHRLYLEHGSSDFDVKHQLEFDYTYELPAAPLLPKWLGGGWQANGITVMRSGLPVQIISGVDTAGVGSDQGLAYGPRPNYVAGQDLRPSNYSLPFNQININALSVPATGTFGNLGRNVYRGPSIFNWDFSLFRNFPIRERQRIEFRAEMFNIFNTPEFDRPQANLSAPATFGQSLSTILSAGGFGSSRQIQFGLKYLF